MDNKIYIVEYSLRKTGYAEAAPISVDYNYGHTATCPLCGAYVASAPWKRPREVVLTSRKTPDFLYAHCDVSPFLLSENALQKIQNSGLKGILAAEKIEHVRFQRRSKQEAPIPTCYHIELARSKITINHEKSNIVYGQSSDRRQCSLCRQVPATYDFFRKLCLNMDDYEGYDIFYIYELGDAVLLSQRFVDFCKENNLTNLHYTIAEQYMQWASAYFLDGDETAGDEEEQRDG